MLIARELNDRTLVPLFDRQEEAPERCCLITTAASRQRPDLRAFRNWILREAARPPPLASPTPDPGRRFPSARPSVRRFREPRPEAVGTGEERRLAAGVDEQHPAARRDPPRAHMRDQPRQRLSRRPGRAAAPSWPAAIAIASRTASLSRP